MNEPSTTSSVDGNFGPGCLWTIMLIVIYFGVYKVFDLLGQRSDYDYTAWGYRGLAFMAYGTPVFVLVWIVGLIVIVTRRRRDH